MSDNNIVVVVPVFNGEKFLEKTLLSVSKQSLKPALVLVVDDCSTDNTPDIVSRITDLNVKYLKTSHNFGGPAGPRNLAINWIRQNCKSVTHISFLDADDIWPNNFLEIMTYVSSNKSLVFANVKKFSKDPVVFKKKNRYTKKKIYRWMFGYCNPITSCSSNLLRWDLIGETRFRIEKQYIALEDYFFFMELAHKTNEIYFLVDLKVGYRQSMNSLSSSTISMAKKRIFARVHHEALPALNYGSSLKAEMIYLLSKATWAIIKKLLSYSS